MLGCLASSDFSCLSASVSSDRRDHRLAVLLSNEPKAKRRSATLRSQRASRSSLPPPACSTFMSRRPASGTIPGINQRRRHSAYGLGDPAPHKPIAGERLVAPHCERPRRRPAKPRDELSPSHQCTLKPRLRTAYRNLGWMGTHRTPAVIFRGRWRSGAHNSAATPRSIEDPRNDARRVPDKRVFDAH
jgi:hypothetical protein